MSDDDAADAIHEQHIQLYLAHKKALDDYQRVEVSAEPIRAGPVADLEVAHSSPSLKEILGRTENALRTFEAEHGLSPLG